MRGHFTGHFPLSYEGNEDHETLLTTSDPFFFDARTRFTIVGSYRDLPSAYVPR